MGETHAISTDAADAGGRASDSSNPTGGAGDPVVRAGVGNVTATGESSALISLIERAARDPSVDIDKMERLFQMHAAVEQRNAKTAYLAAFSALQSELPAAVKRGTGHNKAKYARYEDLIEVLRPLLHRYGFSISHRVATAGNVVTVTGILGHSGGHSEETHFTAPPDTSGGKVPIQAIASTIGYGKRYVTLTLTGIATENEDDDATRSIEAASDDRPKTLSALKQLIEQTKADVAWLCGHYSVETLDDLTAKQIADATAGLMARKRKQESGK